MNTQAGGELPCGFRLGRYAVVDPLGRGSMAWTYRACGPGGRLVALKVPHRRCLGDPTFVVRFLQEGALGARLHHPAIVRVLEAGEDEGRLFIAMELVEGRTLASLLANRTPLPLGPALAIARDVASALAHAHGKGVIHRDLKPENVMLSADGSTRVLDFGIARIAGERGLTTAGTFIGSPRYAAPEAASSPVDARADLYALGIILFEMLEGAPPFDDPSPVRLLLLHARQPLPAPKTLPVPLPDDVWQLVSGLCAKDPAARLHDAGAVQAAIDRVRERLGPAPAGGA
ncbi:MAG TPA: serine/threonine-protein kinase [Thermoanaerobaculaceae bacterium]|nr:serine/threonine-protein kinase [Thermoanaerobaculaceae bacterium]HRS14956.1 serine/threonine-protein kinase [Thermoanaerobaculaceae bacterium]